LVRSLGSRPNVPPERPELFCDTRHCRDPSTAPASGH
jgi:hypothetical protein